MAVDKTILPKGNFRSNHTKKIRVCQVVRGSFKYDKGGITVPTDMLCLSIDQVHFIILQFQDGYSLSCTIMAY